MSRGDIVVKVDRRLSDLVPRFIARCGHEAAALNRAADAGEWAAARMIGHALHGTGGGYGLDEVTNIGRETESAAERRDAPALRQLAERLADYIARVKPVFE
jgi:HPt (histidine-containing phosphotransfer) domain-containing protein